MVTMKHYYWEKDNKIIVQNCVMGMMGQQHEHTKDDFADWIRKNKIKEENLILMK